MFVVCELCSLCENTLGLDMEIGRGCDASTHTVPWVVLCTQPNVQGSRYGRVRVGPVLQVCARQCVETCADVSPLDPTSVLSVDLCLSRPTLEFYVTGGKVLTG